MNYQHPWQLKKIKILGAVLELPAINTHCQSSPFTSKLGQIGQIGSAILLVAPKRLPGFWFFSIAMDADYLFHVKSVATFALISFVYIISILVSVRFRKGFVWNICKNCFWNIHTAKWRLNFVKTQMDENRNRSYEIIFPHYAADSA